MKSDNNVIAFSLYGPFVSIETELLQMATVTLV